MLQGQKTGIKIAGLAALAVLSVPLVKELIDSSRIMSIPTASAKVDPKRIPYWNMWIAEGGSAAMPYEDFVNECLRRSGAKGYEDVSSTLYGPDCNRNGILGK